MNDLYLAFTLDHDEAEASARFVDRFGAPPENIVEDGGNLLVGPLPVDWSDKLVRFCVEHSAEPYDVSRDL